MPKLLSLILAFVLSASVYGAESSHGGIDIPLSQVLQSFTVADVANSKSWCSPATQIGPRVFMTAAHCVPMLDGVRKLNVRTDSGNELVSYRVVAAIPPLTDETSLDTASCRTLIASKPEGGEISLEEMKACWAGNGAMDVALLITDRAVVGRMVSLATKRWSSGEKLVLFGWADSRVTRTALYRRTQFRPYGAIGAQVVLDGARDGSWGQSGESGGIYFNDRMEAVAVNTGGTDPNHLNIQIFGENVRLPANFAGGADLTNPDTRRWLDATAARETIEICGLNVVCPAVSKPVR